MRHKLSFGVGILIIAGAVIMNINSCSVIGYGIGSMADSSQRDQNDISVSQVKAMAPGTAIIITLKDTSQLSGKYIGSEMMPADQYAQSYKQACEELSEIIYLPAVGDSFVLLSNEKATFLGFDYDRILFRGKKGNTLGGNIANIDTLTDSNGNKIEIEIVKKLINEGKVPLLSVINIMEAAEKKQARLDSIEIIQIPTKKQGKLNGFLIGIVLDLFIILSLRNFSLGPIRFE